jgi:hypothetical protein
MIYNMSSLTEFTLIKHSNDKYLQVQNQKPHTWQTQEAQGVATPT